MSFYTSAFNLKDFYLEYLDEEELHILKHVKSDEVKKLVKTAFKMFKGKKYPNSLDYFYKICFELPEISYVCFFKLSLEFLIKRDHFNEDEVGLYSSFLFNSEKMLMNEYERENITLEQFEHSLTVYAYTFYNSLTYSSFGFYNLKSEINETLYKYLTSLGKYLSTFTAFPGEIAVKVYGETKDYLYDNVSTEFKYEICKHLIGDRLEQEIKTVSDLDYALKTLDEISDYEDSKDILERLITKLRKQAADYLLVDLSTFKRRYGLACEIYSLLGDKEGMRKLHRRYIEER